MLGPTTGYGLKSHRSILFSTKSSSADSAAFASTSHVQPTPAVECKKVPRKSARARKVLDHPAAGRANIAKARTAANAAYKKARKQGNHQRRSGWTHVFVGNIAAEVDEAALRDHFKGCGTVVSANIRCSGGIAMSVKPDINYYRDHKVRQYAIVYFATEQAVSKAMLLSGSRLGDAEITVCRSAGDLPEVQEKIQERIVDYRARNGFADVSRARRSAVRSLKLEPTLMNEQQRRAPAFRLFGISFCMNIMG